MFERKPWVWRYFWIPSTLLEKTSSTLPKIYVMKIAFCQNHQLHKGNSWISAKHVDRSCGLKRFCIQHMEVNAATRNHGSAGPDTEDAPLLMLMLILGVDLEILDHLDAITSAARQR
eukprot:UN22849